jgi:hypothetical protein
MSKEAQELPMKHSNSILPIGSGMKNENESKEDDSWHEQWASI